jgi:hypothetical protein
LDVVVEVAHQTLSCRGHLHSDEQRQHLGFVRAEISRTNQSGKAAFARQQGSKVFASLSNVSGHLVADTLEVSLPRTDPGKARQRPADVSISHVEAREVLRLPTFGTQGNKCLALQQHVDEPWFER